MHKACREYIQFYDYHIEKIKNEISEDLKECTEEFYVNRIEKIVEQTPNALENKNDKNSEATRNKSQLKELEAMQERPSQHNDNKNTLELPSVFQKEKTKNFPYYKTNNIDDVVVYNDDLAISQKETIKKWENNPPKSSQSHSISKIDVLSNGNCAYNSLAIGLGKIVLTYKENLSNRIKTNLMSLFTTAKVNVPDYSYIIQYFQNFTYEQWQKELAPALRAIAVNYLRNDKSFVNHYLNYLINAYKNYITNNIYDDTFMVHPFIEAEIISLKVDDLREEHTKLDDLTKWWNKNGWNTYLSEISKSASDENGRGKNRWGGQELEILARYFNLGIEYTANGNSVVLHSPLGAVDCNFEEEVLNQLVLRGIIDGETLNYYFHQKMKNFAIIESRCADLTILLQEGSDLDEQTIREAQKNLAISTDHPILKNKFFQQLFDRSIIVINRTKDEIGRMIGYKWNDGLINNRNTLAERLAGIGENIMIHLKNEYAKGSKLLIKLGYNGSHWWYEECEKLLNHEMTYENFKQTAKCLLLINNGGFFLGKRKEEKDENKEMRFNKGEKAKNSIRKPMGGILFFACQDEVNPNEKINTTLEEKFQFKFTKN